MNSQLEVVEVHGEIPDLSGKFPRKPSAAARAPAPEPRSTPAPEPSPAAARRAEEEFRRSEPSAKEPLAKRQRLEDEQDVPRAAKQAWAREQSRATEAINAGGDEGHLARRAWRAWQAELKAATHRQFWGVPNAG